MKRRLFIQTLAVTSAVSLPAVSEAQAQQSRRTPARAPEETAALELTTPEAAAETPPRFFNPLQFSALCKLSAVLMPPLDGRPGALEAGVPEFLDFLIGASSTDRKQIYTAGLDALNAEAGKRFNQPYAEVTEAQAAELLAPLRRPWTADPPADPLAHFLREAKRDVRTATVNSQEYITAGSSGGRRSGGLGQYWYPIE